MRVRILELRLIALALLASWTLAGVLVLLGYRPGGPIDLLVGGSATLPAFVAFAAFRWPPLVRGQGSFSGLVWLGFGSLLVLVPAIGILLGQLLTRSPQTLLPSVEAGYPWLLALVGTSLLAGFGLARRSLGATSSRRRRLSRAALVALGLTVGVATLFTTVAVANEIALRERPVADSRFGPTDPTVEPPACGKSVTSGPAARVELAIGGDVDGRRIGSIVIRGVRTGDDYRWIASVAGRLQLGQYGAARLGPVTWSLSPGSRWHRVADTDLFAGGLDARVIALALEPGRLAAAENHGVAFVEGARAHHCRVAIDGQTFRSVFPHVAWLIGRADLHRWRGELDYWVFADGQVGQVIGSVNGDATGIGFGGIQATLQASLTATDRAADLRVLPPAP